jgi:hypothetical protein
VRYYMCIPFSAIRHYTSPSNLDSQANGHWKTTEATCPDWRFASHLLSVRAQPGTRNHGEPPQTGRRGEAGERLGNVETPHVSSAMSSRTHPGANRTMHQHRKLSLPTLALALVNRHRGTVTSWRRRTKQTLQLRHIGLCMNTAWPTQC